MGRPGATDRASLQRRQHGVDDRAVTGASTTDTERRQGDRAKIRLRGDHGVRKEKRAMGSRGKRLDVRAASSCRAIELAVAAGCVVNRLHNLWKSLLAWLPPSCRISPDPKRREALLKILIIAAIMLSAGPEIATAMELRILLEILGATLFTTAFIAGARVIFLILGENLRSLWLPVAPVALVAIAYAEWWLATAVAGIASVHGLLELLP